MAKKGRWPETERQGPPASRGQEPAPRGLGQTRPSLEVLLTPSVPGTGSGWDSVQGCAFTRVPAAHTRRWTREGRGRVLVMALDPGSAPGRWQTLKLMFVEQSKT